MSKDNFYYAAPPLAGLFLLLPAPIFRQLESSSNTPSEKKEAQSALPVVRPYFSPIYAYFTN